jgi:hypothetical protein
VFSVCRGGDALLAIDPLLLKRSRPRPHPFARIFPGSVPTPPARSWRHNRTRD